MTRSEYTQHADPAVRRRAAMRSVKLPEGVNALHCADGKINGEDVLLLFTTDGLYSVRDGVARVLRHRLPPHRRRAETVEDVRMTGPVPHRDYRPLWIALVGVATALALWWTL